MSIDYNIEVGKGRLNFNTGYLAKQAHGAVVVSYGETIVFATAVIDKNVREGQDFFPLTVDYREKSYAAGKIPGGFIKRESRPSDRETLVCRLTDRPLRPLFPPDFINEVQIIIYVLSHDKQNQPDVLAINAASAALSVSGIPFRGPVGAVRVGRIGGELVVNPTFTEMKESDIDLVVAGTKKAVTMIEGSSKNISEAEMLAAVEFAHENIKKICAAQDEFASQVNKPAINYTSFTADAGLKSKAVEVYFKEVEGLIQYKDKKEREDAFDAIVEKAKSELEEQFPETIGQIRGIIDDMDGEIIRKRILDEGVRADGRGLKDIRPIDIMAGILPRAHGSAVFTRGQTQSLGITTLGTIADAQRLDSLEGESHKRFMLHYHFPPFCVGETGRTGGVGRREIGHGMLAERALEYAIPESDVFPYTIRQVSEVLESNGSSSMATVCSGSLAMYNAGVPLKAAVAGIAMGLILENDRFAILSDILGLEDHLGDMDFKVAGTSEGITAFQLDIKVEGITTEIMRVALEQAREGRLHILGKMNTVVPAPEENLSPYAPRLKTIKIDPEKIGTVIGPGGKVIKKIIEECGVGMNVEDDGTVSISSDDLAAIDKAEKIILSLVEEVKVGAIYDGTVKKIMEFGAFVEILPGKEGLVHISNLDHTRVRAVTDVVSVGDKFKVKVIKVDKQGRIDLSRKEAMDL
ncbi:MAG: polyribonucleotide nucleotidyltransferase [Spirochaetae bacterium HGW-Spirochaetae-1]|jgi:polyribonucleotide nucleotidyltransferase|nr:MAG: polyribonucleotide nucleotidyltransferase [Spirochaetae bacterium HGW-Spirochaetae-1]